MPSNLARQARHLVELSFDSSGTPNVERVRSIVHAVEGRLQPWRARSLLKAFRTEFRRESERRTVRIEHAGPLPQEIIAQFGGASDATCENQCRLVVEENPRLVAGVRLRHGDDIYDASIRCLLDQLESTQEQ